MSSVLDHSETASVIGSAGHVDDTDATSDVAATASPTPSSSPLFAISCERSSPIWQYCRKEEGRSYPSAWIDSNGSKWWHCQPCHEKNRAKKYNYSSGSSAIANHLRKEHKIMITGRRDCKREVTRSRLGDITAFLSNESLISNKKRKATTEENALDQATLRELYCRYTVACSLPFAHIEQPAFRDLVRYIRPAADDLLPTCGDTVKHELKRAYGNKKEFAKRALQNALSAIHIVPDNWTSRPIHSSPPRSFPCMPT